MSQVDWGSIIVDLPGDPTLLEQLKSYLGIEDGSQDQELNDALSKAGDAMETYLDRIIAKREITEHFAHHFGTVVLHHLPVENPVTVVLDGAEDAADWSWYKDKADQAHLTRIGIEPDKPFDWRIYNQVDVTYTAGYDPVPSDLAYAIVATAAGYFNAEGTGSTPGGASGDLKTLQLYDVGAVTYDVGGSGSSSQGAFMGYTGFIPSTVAQTIQAYRRMSA